MEIICLGCDNTPENKLAKLKNYCIKILGEEIVYDLKKMGCTTETIRKLGAYPSLVFQALNLGKQY